MSCNREVIPRDGHLTFQSQIISRVPETAFDNKSAGGLWRSETRCKQAGVAHSAVFPGCSRHLISQLLQATHSTDTVIGGWSVPKEIFTKPSTADFCRRALRYNTSRVNPDHVNSTPFV
eukprot:4330477-Pleurochrysis_carterae.AAC.2